MNLSDFMIACEIYRKLDDKYVEDYGFDVLRFLFKTCNANNQKDEEQKGGNNND